MRSVFALLVALAATPALGQQDTETAPAEEPPAATAEPLVVTPAAEPEAEAAPAYEGAVELDTIEVTASKRIKAQRDIPGSVGAIRGADLESMRAQGMRDYMKLIPGVVYSDQGNEESVPVIRGIATNVAFGATPVTTGIYMDDMPFADLFTPSSIPDLNPFDLERVEVLKGPQGTLFGSGALAGAVRYIVQKPNHGVWEGKAMATMSRTELSNEPSPVYAAAANVPLFGDAVALRVVGLQRVDSGYHDMGAVDDNGAPIRNDEDADRLDQTSARALASWNVSDELTLSGFYFDQKSRQDDWGVADGPDEPKSTMFPFPSPRDHDFGGGNLSAVYEAPWARVLGSYNRMTKHNYYANHQEFAFGLENQDDDEYVVISRDDVDGYTGELRVASTSAGPWEWLVGGSYLNYGNSSFFFSYLGPDQPDPRSRADVTPDRVNTAQVYSEADQVAYETAVFGEVTRKLGEFFELTVGARRYETRLKASTNLCGAQIVALFQQQCYPEHFDNEESGINPKVSLRYTHDRNMQVYVLAAKGFQFGGVQINPPAPGFPESTQAAGYHWGPYESSELWNYELGVRTEWLDRRLRFDATVFYLDWKDLQMTVAVPLQPTNLPFQVIANVAGAHSEGLELALEVLPFNGAKFTTAAAFMSSLTDVLFDANAGDGGVKPGTKLPGAPSFQWATTASYEHAVPYFASWIVNPTLTYVFVGEAKDQIRPTGTIGDYSTLDARISLLQPSSRYQPEISLGMNNITDTRGASFHVGGSLPTDGSAYSLRHFIPPRTALLSVSVRY